MINPGLRFGRYEVGARLGKGGFGYVHQARDTELGRELAIKFLRPEYLPRQAIVQRFLQEARAAAKIGHPGIVTVFECGLVMDTGTRADGTAFIAMELLRGESLADRLMNGGRMASATALLIARQLADALGAAHAAAIIHRDLKPDNVFLVPDAALVGGQRVKVLDFGVAKLAEPSDQGVHTHSQMLLGTPRYMSPEQARSAAKVDTRSDIYTLGCILFELLAGRPPFDGDSGELIAKHQRDPAPALRTIVPSTPAAYETLVERMLAKSPDARPQTMVEIAAALGEIGGSTETPAPAVGPPPDREAATTIAHASSQRRMSRKVVVAILALAVVAGVLIAISIGVGGGRSASSGTVVGFDAPRVAVEPPRVDAAPLPPQPPGDVMTDDVKQVVVRCVELKSKRKWSELETCANELEEKAPGTGAELRTRAELEARMELVYDRLNASVSTGQLDDARSLLDRIAEASVYRRDAERLVVRAETHVPTPGPPAHCNVSNLMSRGDAFISNGDFNNALTAFEAAYRCTPDSSALQRAYLSACKAGRAAKARELWRLMSPSIQHSNTIMQICMNSGIDVRK